MELRKTHTNFGTVFSKFAFHFQTVVQPEPSPLTPRDGSRGQVATGAAHAQVIVARATGIPGEAERGQCRRCYREHRCRCIRASTAAAGGRRHRLQQQRIGCAVQHGVLNPGNAWGGDALLWALPEAVPEPR